MENHYNPVGKKHKERNYFMIKYVLQILLNATLLKSVSSVKYQRFKFTLQKALSFP